MKLESITPVLRSFNEELAVKFYVDYLGFNIDWRHRFESDFPLYMQVSRDACVIHLSEHHGDCCPGSTVRIDVDDVDAYYSELSKKKYSNVKPSVELMPWGTRDMSIKDPFGNRLVFTTAVST